MEIGIENQNTKGFITGWCVWLKALPCMFKEKVVEVAEKTKIVGKDDPRRMIHSIKVALALTLVSLFYYFRPLYDGFGASGMWAVLTVVVVFEFTVGATLSKSINRGFATLLAGVLGVGAEYFADIFGEKGEPIVLGFLVFLLGATSTFTRFLPHIKRRYDYGVLIFILTFSLVSVSGYRVGKIMELAQKRLSTIIIGAATCMIISIFFCPVWAGEDLHNLEADNVEKLASFLEGFGEEYFKEMEDDGCAMDSKNDKPFLQQYKSVLNSKATEESLANFAWWEPGHGSFRFRHPWKQYLKIGVLIRQCAYQFETLGGYINSKPQTQSEIQKAIQESCKKISLETSLVLKKLGSAIKTMVHPSEAATHAQNLKIAIDKLKGVLETSSLEKSGILEIIPAITVASTLFDIVQCVEEILEAVHELSDLAQFKSTKEIASLEKPSQLLHRGIVQPVSDGETDHIVIDIDGYSQDKQKNNGYHATKEDHQVGAVNICN